jgi:glycosyltransferase involved in cell wall biosynthesis
MQRRSFHLSAGRQAQVLMRTEDVYVIIPAYNEGSVIRETIASLIPYGYSIVVVDDGSAVPASQFLAGQPIYYLRHLTNLGQGAALQTGTDFALSKGAQVIVHFDADGQHSAESIPRLTEPIRNQECDAVLGSRFLNEEDRKLVPLEKRMVLKAGVFVTWLFSGMWLSDTHNGFRVLSRSAAEKIRITENGFAHATEILECIRRSRLRYREMPTTIRYTDYSRNKGQSIFNSINIVFDLVLRKVLR